MPARRLGLVHTSAALVPAFAELCREKLPGVDVFHIADESLVREVIARGRLTARVARRLVDHVASAEESGADLVLVTCSTVGPAVEAAAPLVGIPVVRVDQPMADRAVATGPRVGVVATLPSTLEPTTDLLRRRGVAAGRTVSVVHRLCDGAFAALASGDAARHDAMVASAIEDLGRETDVVVLAQASMARVIPGLDPARTRVPVLASPALAVDHVAERLGLGPAPSPG